MSGIEDAGYFAVDYNLDALNWYCLKFRGSVTMQPFSPLALVPISLISGDLRINGDR